MQHAYLPIFDDIDEPAPATARASSLQMSQLVALTLPPSEELTPFQGAPSLDLIVAAAGDQIDEVTLMRALYACGDTESALALASSIGRGVESNNNGFTELSLEELDGTFGW